MPIYEYRCQKCGVFEVSQKITDKPLDRCPSCKGKAKKLISNTSFQLKGTGWYITDYARKEKSAKGKEADKTPRAEAKGDGKAGASSEAAEKKPSKTASSESSAA